MAELGISPHTISMILNHVSARQGTITSKVYVQYSYDREKREALVAWSTRLEAIRSRPKVALESERTFATGLNHIEIKFSAGTVVHDDTSGSLHAFELNYGLIPNGQLTIDAPIAFDSPSDGAIQFGYGDTQVSFRYRFIQEDEKGWRRKLPSSCSSNCRRATKAVGLLPIWAQKRFGEWTTYGGRRLLDQPRQCR